ncbi:MAG: phosphotransferase [Lachnospirales bacterium]
MDSFIKEKVESLLNLSSQNDVKVVEKLLGGMSNHMYVIEVNGEKFTFRIPGKNANNFVTRDIEKQNIELVDSLDINNETVVFDVEIGYKISRYVEGKCLVEVDYQEHLEEISSILKKIHNSGLKAVNDYEWLSRLDKYEKLVLNQGYTDESDEYYALKKSLTEDFDYFNNNELVLCHGDSQISNFVVGLDKIYLLDWEFCGNNDPYYDIACFGNKDFDDALRLLDVYLGRKANDEEIKKLNYFRAFQCLQWHNVALYKHLIGLSEELNVPFGEVAKGYTEKAKAFLSNAR